MRECEVIRLKILQYIVVVVATALMIVGMFVNDIRIVCGFGFLSVINLLLIFVDEFGEMKTIQKDSVKVNLLGHFFKKGEDDDVDD